MPRIPSIDPRHSGVAADDFRHFGLGTAAPVDTSIPHVDYDTAYSEAGLKVFISSSDSGPSNFKFTINPVFYDAIDEGYIKEIPILHGANAYHKKYFDDRVRILKWENIELDNVNFDNMVNYFRSIKGLVRYFNFGTIDNINTRWPSTDTWKKVRVLGVKASYKSGGKLKYENFELKVQPLL